MTVLVRGAVLHDGEHQPYQGDLRIGADGRVGEVGDLRPGEGEEVIDAAGRALAPGFVDMHSHSDLWTLVRQSPSGSLSGDKGPAGVPLGDGPKLLQGCTMQVFGQDGISAAPVADDDVDAYADYIAGLDGYLDPSEWRWRTFGAYLAELRRRSSTRVAGLVGHSTVRRLVMGMEARPPTADELTAMQDAVATAMDEGAIGLSTGLVYAPAAYSTTEELVALNTVVAAKGGRFFVHVRSESDRVVEATHEVLEVARRTRVHLHYSHIKTAGRANWPAAERLLEMIEDYRKENVRITADVHPYTAGSTTASVLLPPWVLEGGLDVALARLAESEVRGRIRQQVLTDTTSWDNWWAFSDGWDGLHVADTSSGREAGRSFAEVIAEAGVADDRSEAAFDVVFDLLVGERLAVSLVSFNNVEDNVARFLAQPYTSVGSDALVNPTGHPHPRLYGTFPRVLGRFARELGVVSLPLAVHAMTARAADTLGLETVGRLCAGAPADMVLFDPETVIDRATFDEPRLPPVGIDRVWVGGAAVVVGGQLRSEVPAAEVS